MKIALVSPYDFPYPGGVTEHIVALANGIRQRGHEVQILAACSGYKGEVFPHTRPVTRTVTSIPIGGTRARVGISPLSYIRIKKILEQENFDVIHLQEPLTPGITWLVLTHAYNLPDTVTVGTFHAYHERPNWLYKRGRPIFSKFFSKLNTLIAVSQAAYNFAYQMFPGDYHIIPNGVDLNRFGKPIEKILHPAPSNSQKPLTILFVGRLHKRKGFQTLLKAFIQLKSDYPQLKLQVVGPYEPATCQPYQKIAQAYGVTDIEFVGYVSPDMLPTYYHQADIFCAPSLGFESFGIILLEAMAAGLPIVASDIAGYRSVISTEKEGLLVPPKQPEALVTALSQLLDRPDQRQKIAKNGRIKANQYSWDHIVDKTLNIYLNTYLNRHKIITYSNDRVQRRPGDHVQRSRTQI